MPTPEYIQFFLNAQTTITGVDTIELSHPNIATTYYFNRQIVEGFTATDENMNSRLFTYAPLSVEKLQSNETLDQSFRISIGDVGNTLKKEVDAINNVSPPTSIPATLIYRAYRSDQPTNILFGPIRLEIRTFSFSNQGASFEAEAPRVNIHGTGERYLISRFPMLRGFL